MSPPKSHKIKENKETEADKFFEELEKLNTETEIKKLNLVEIPFTLAKKAEVEVIEKEDEDKKKAKKSKNYQEPKKAEKSIIFFESKYSDESAGTRQKNVYQFDAIPYFQIKEYREETEILFKSKYDEVSEQMSDKKKK